MSDFEVFSLLAGMGLFGFVVAVGIYFLYTFGLYKMAQSSGIANPWFAFVPILQYYTWGKIIGDTRMGRVVPNLGIVLLIAPIAYFILSLMFGWIPLIGWLIDVILFLAYLALYTVALYYLYAKYSNSAMLLMILSVVSFGILTPFIVFVIRNNQPIRAY